MDIVGWQREQEMEDLLALQDDFEKGHFSMAEQGFIRDRQDEAMQAYDRLQDTGAAMQALQAAMLAEVALQLAKQNSLLERIARRLEKMDDESSYR